MQKTTPRTVAILIPALDPDQHLIEIITELVHSETGKTPIVVVDDGSESQTIFNEILGQFGPRVKVLYHQYNRGKGEALKTGFRYLLEQDDIVGIATMDSDGQHTVADVKRCIALFQRHPQSLILGVRTFPTDIPWRSRFGNQLTESLVRKLTGLKITDTQTGLRVIPATYARDALAFTGERYAFEFEMLLQTRKKDVAVLEQPIQTIYIDSNRASHFRVIRDSLSIYLRFVKFALSGAASFLIDIVLYTLIVWLTKSYSLDSIMGATVIARLLSSIANYMINHKLVFNNEGHATLVKYFALMCVQMIVSGYLTHGLTQILMVVVNSGLISTAAKMIVDFGLFLVSYQIQKRLIFCGEGPHGIK